MQYYYVRTNYPNADITLYDSIEDCLDAVLKGTSTEAQKNVVIANAAAAISVMEKKSLIDCLEIAKESLESGKALKSFTKFVEING